MLSQSTSFAKSYRMHAGLRQPLMSAFSAEGEYGHLTQVQSDAAQLRDRSGMRFLLGMAYA
jgi:hypothetical protein